MKNIESYMESGILEMYVLGLLSAEEIKEVEEMAALHAEIRKELEEITVVLKEYSEVNTKPLNFTLKAMMLAAIDYEERLKSGEQPTFPPILNEHSTIEDYSAWLDRKDIVIPNNFKDTYVKIIGYTPEASTAIVWIETETPYEVHTDEHEKFFILEGSCDIDIDGDIHSLVPGDYLSIPLHSGHIVKVTSKTPCKVILQRVAA